MATEIPIVTASFEANADLSTKQFHFVKMDGANARKIVACSAVTDRPIGVLQNNPGLGKMATVMMLGQTKLVADVNLAPNAEIGTSADGQAIAVVDGTDTTKYKVGFVLDENTVAGGIISAWINCMSAGRAV